MDAGEALLGDRLGLQIWVWTGLAALFAIEFVVADSMLRDQVAPVEVIPTSQVWGEE